MSQCQDVLDYMRRHGSITQGEAYTLGCSRLAARIEEIDGKDGIVINRSTIRGRKANGKDANVRRYSITPAPAGLSAPLMKLTDAPDQQGGLFDVPVPREAFEKSGKAER